MAKTIQAAQAESGTIIKGMKGDVVTLIQMALRAAGHELVIDGDYGPNTEAAVESFQAAHKLQTVGYVGPKTAAALDAVLAKPEIDLGEPAVSVKDFAPWLTTMRAMTGVKEIPGIKDSPIIMAWPAEIAKYFPDMAAYCKTYKHDSIAWCGLGIARACAINGVRPVPGFLYALNWQKIAKKKLAKPIVGAIGVFKRTGGGHVGIYEGEDKSNWKIRGCNQSDQVSLVNRPKRSDLVGFYWPDGMPMPTKTVVGATSGAVSHGSEA